MGSSLRKRPLSSRRPPPPPPPRGRCYGVWGWSEEGIPRSACGSNCASLECRFTGTLVPSINKIHDLVVSVLLIDACMSSSDERFTRQSTQLSWNSSIGLTLRAVRDLSAGMRSLSVPRFSTSGMATTVLSMTPNQKVHFATTYYTGPSQLLLRLTTGSAIQGIVPQMTGPSLNSSYTLSFGAPTVQCRNTSSASLHGFLTHMMGFAGGSPRPAAWYAYQYVAWTPNPTALVPWAVKGVNITSKIDFDSSSPTEELSSYVGQYEGTPPSVYVATLPPNSTTWEVLNCSFYDATYTVDFKFINGISSADVVEIQSDNDHIVVSNALSYTSLDPNDTDGAMLQTPILTSKQVGYQALIESFGRVVVGTIGSLQRQLAPVSGFSGINTVGSFTVEGTSVLSTNLAYSDELAPISAYSTSPVQCNHESQYGCIWIPESSNLTLTGMTLGASLEQLFENMTLALFSEPEFVSNEDVPQTNVSVTHLVPQYHYSVGRLALAYGIAVLFALVAVVIGGVTILANGVSYSDKFSTVLAGNARAEYSRVDCGGGSKSWCGPATTRNREG